MTEQYGDVEQQLESKYRALQWSNYSDAEKRLLEQSHQAYLADIASEKLAIRQADCLNGMIVTDSEDEDPDEYLQLNISSERAHALIEKKVFVEKHNT